MDQPKYKRIVLKLSGESLLPSGSKYGIAMQSAKLIAEEVKKVKELGVEIAIVIGGGNIFRGVKAEEGGMDRVRADSMGMLATVINGFALLEAFEKLNTGVKLFSARKIEATAELYTPQSAKHALKDGNILILTFGTGNPFFSTDTAASLRAVEIEADILLKGTKVDGVYDKDPVTNPDAKLFKHLTYDEVLSKNLKVMDSTSVSMCRDNKIPIIVFNIFKQGNLMNTIKGIQTGTHVYDK